jgi:hypothetical protein
VTVTLEPSVPISTSSAVSSSCRRSPTTVRRDRPGSHRPRGPGPPSAQPAPCPSCCGATGTLSSLPSPSAAPPPPPSPWPTGRRSPPTRRHRCSSSNDPIRPPPRCASSSLTVDPSVAPTVRCRIASTRQAVRPRSSEVGAAARTGASGRPCQVGHRVVCQSLAAQSAHAWSAGPPWPLLGAPSRRYPACLTVSSGPGKAEGSVSFWLGLAIAPSNAA